MIPDLQTSLTCDDVRQERNGKYMLIGIFDGLIVPAERPIGPKICVVNRWCMGKGKFTQKTRILSPDGTTVAAEGKPVEIDMQSEQQVNTTVEAFINIPFKVEGVYWVEILLDQQMRIRYPLHIRHYRPQANSPKA